MKIGINVGGYHSIGTGHTYRQLSLMEEQLDFEYFFYVNNSQNLACQLLEENFINYRIFNNIEELFNLIKNDKIDIIINDFLDTNEDYIKNLKLNNLFVVNFEDRGSGIKYADIVINDMYENKLIENCMNIFNGFKYTCMRRDLKLYKPLKFKNICKNIIITFGGSDPQNFTKLVLDILISNKIYENMKIIVILGLGYKYDNNIYEYRKYNIIVLKNVQNMPIILQKADIGITANGRTLFEFAHFGIPCISLAQNDREKIHTFAKEDNGVIFLGERKDFTDNDLLISINKLINNHNYRKKLSENMKQANKILQNSNDNIWKLILDKYNFQNIDIILQCRLNSSRLPNKAIKIIVNKKMIEHQIERLKRCKNINNIILCTSTNIENNILINIANEMDIKYFRGSEDNVLERFYQCAKKYKSKNIIRCTGDCPLIDPSLIDLLCENFVKKKINHLNFRNKDITRNNNFPDGFDAEIFTFEVLEEAYKNDNSDFGKEHVTPYIVKKYGKNYCQIPNVEKYNLDNFHYSVDTEEDLKKIEEIYNELYPKNDKFSLYDILNYLNYGHSNLNNNKLNCKFCNFCKKENPMELYYPNVRNCQDGHIVKCKECDLRQLIRKKNVSLKEFYLNDGQDKAIQNITKISKVEQIESEVQTMIQRAKIIQEKINELKLVKKEIKIIDVGGGYGNLSLEIRKLNINNDINLQIDILEPRNLENLFYTEYNLNKITTFLDYDFVEKNKNKYDFVLNYHVLEHVSNPVDFLKNMYDLINENGYLCLEVPNDDLDLIQINKKYADKINYIESHENYFTKITLSKICMKIGINPEIKGFQIYGYENYNNWVKNIPNKIGKEIDFFTNNYKKDSKEYKWYNDKIINFTCDTIYFIHKKITYNQQQYLKILPNEYELENIIFDNTNFENNSIEIVKEMINLYNKMNNNASGDWKWISNNKINIDELFKSNNYNEIDKLYSNFSRNFISFGIISNGIYENLIKNDKMMFTLKQNILNDIDTCIELCDITNINVLDSSRIGNFYGINKNNVFITPDNIRHY